MVSLNQSNDYISVLDTASEVDCPELRSDDNSTKVIKYSLKWQLNMESQVGYTSVVYSPHFFFGRDDEHETCIAFYPDGEPSTTSGKPSIYLKFLSQIDMSLIKGKIKFEDRNGPSSTPISAEIMLNKDTVSPGLGWSWGIRDFVQVIPTSDMYMMNRRPKELVCTIHLVVDKEKDLSVSQHMEKMFRDMGTLLTTGNVSDITIEVEEQILKAHKAILAARSPVFSAMLQSDMQEARSNIICITDVSYPTMQHLLTFMYTGRFPDLHDSAEGLMLAADKYGLEDLKFTCGDFLAKNLTVDNSTRLLLLADTLSDKHLWNCSVRYIKRNIREVKDTEDWKELKRSRIDLIIDTFVES